MTTPLYPDYFEPSVRVTAKYKQTMNLQIIDKLHYLLGEMEVKKNYLQQYWYSLKYMVHAVHAVHAVYHLLHKILEKYGNEGMC